MFVLCAIISCGSLKSGITKYWRFTDAIGTKRDAADGGIPLTDAGRWRSHSTRAYLAEEGLSTVPDNIQNEIAELMKICRVNEMMSPKDPAFFFPATA